MPPSGEGLNPVRLYISLERYLSNYKLGQFLFVLNTTHKMEIKLEHSTNKYLINSVYKFVLVDSYFYFYVNQFY